MSNLLINSDITSEFLSDDEVKALTGSNQFRRQITWLKDRDWQFEINHKNHILISRWYLRLKMSGISLSTFSIDTPSSEPNFGAIT